MGRQTDRQRARGRLPPSARRDSPVFQNTQFALASNTVLVQPDEHQLFLDMKVSSVFERLPVLLSFDGLYRSTGEPSSLETRLGFYHETIEYTETGCGIDHST